MEMTGTAPKTMSNGRTPVFNLFHLSRTGDFVDHCGHHCVVPVWFVAFVPTTGQEERSSSEHGMAKRVRRTLQVLKQVNTLISFDFFLLPRRRASTGLLRMDDDDDEEGEEEEEEDGRKKNGGGVSPAVIGVGIGAVVYAVMFA